MGDLLLELGTKENVVATWDLGKRDLAEFKKSVQPTVLVGSDKGKIDRVCISFFFLSVPNHESSANFFFKLAH